MKKLVATLGASALMAVGAVAAAPAASAHWADACQYDIYGAYALRVMCPTSIPGTQFSMTTLCSNGVRRSTPMTLQGRWAFNNCYPYRPTSSVVYYR